MLWLNLKIYDDKLEELDMEAALKVATNALSDERESAGSRQDERLCHLLIEARRNSGDGRLGVSYQLSFTELVNYDAGQPSITVPLTLSVGKARVDCEAYILYAYARFPNAVLTRGMNDGVYDHKSPITRKMMR